MKHLLILGLSIITACGTAAAAGLDSTVSEALLYQGQARVSRIAQSTLTAGSSEVQLNSFAGTIVGGTLQASCTPSCTVVGVSERPQQSADEVNPTAQKLEREVNELEMQLRAIGLALESINAQRKGLLSLDYNGNAAQGTNLRPRTAEEIAALQNAAQRSLAALEASLVSTEQKKQTTERELAVRREALEQQRAGAQSRTGVTVSVFAETPGQKNLTLSYVTEQANWEPRYALSFDSAKKEANLTLQAFMSQNTGENWNGVHIAVTSATVGTGLDRPAPQPAQLGVYEPRPIALERKALGDMAGNEARAFKESDMVAQSAPTRAGASVKVSELQVATWNFDGRKDLPSDGIGHTFPLSQQKLTAKLMLVAVPSLDTRVYRELELTNGEAAPLPQGDLSLAVDGTFIGQKTLPNLKPSEKWRTGLGYSEQVLAKRTIAKQFESDPGVVRSYRRVERETAIDIENLSNVIQEVTVLEPMPVSQDERIKVEMKDVNPASLPDSDTSRIDGRPGILEWRLNVKPKDKIKLGYSSAIQYSRDLQITGWQ